jgi:hypothetical protein
VFDHHGREIDRVVGQHVRRIGRVGVELQLVAVVGGRVGAVGRHRLDEDLALQRLLERIERDAADLADDGVRADR